MPIYEYECPRCSLRFERKQSFNSGSHEVSCPECGGDVRRIFSVVPIVFKGSGFYSTDNGRSSSNSTIRSSADKDKTDKDTATAAAGADDE